MDYKDAFNIAYDSAIGDGMNEDDAERVALRAVRKSNEEWIERAEYLLDLARERGEL